MMKPNIILHGRDHLRPRDRGMYTRLMSTLQKTFCGGSVGIVVTTKIVPFVVVIYSVINIFSVV